MPCPISAGHHQAGEDLPRVMHRWAGPGRTTGPAQRTGPLAARVTWAASSRSKAPGHDPTAVSGHGDLGVARGLLHPESVLASARTGPSTSPILPAKGIFTCKRSRLADHRRKPEARREHHDYLRSPRSLPSPTSVGLCRFSSVRQHSVAQLYPRAGLDQSSYASHQIPRKPPRARHPSVPDRP
jgi:hypothetical protein